MNRETVIQNIMNNYGSFGISEDEMNEIIMKAREELIVAGENPDDYFREVAATRFMM